MPDHSHLNPKLITLIGIIFGTKTKALIRETPEPGVIPSEDNTSNATYT